MTPSARLRKEANRIVRDAQIRASGLRALADELDSSPPADRLLEMSAAMALAKRSSSQLYRDAKKFGLGWKLPSGQWRFSEQKLRAFLRGEISEVDGEIGEVQGIHNSAERAHLGHEDEDQA